MWSMSLNRRTSLKIYLAGLGTNQLSDFKTIINSQIKMIVQCPTLFINQISMKWNLAPSPLILNSSAQFNVLYFRNICVVNQEIIVMLMFQLVKWFEWNLVKTKLSTDSQCMMNEVWPTNGASSSVKFSPWLPVLRLMFSSSRIRQLSWTRGSGQYLLWGMTGLTTNQLWNGLYTSLNPLI